MIRGLHHIALNTANLERLKGFYVNVLGFEEVCQNGWDDAPMIDEITDMKGSAAKYSFLRAGNLYIEMFQYSAPAAREAAPLRPCDRGYTHICLDVDNIEQEYERLAAAGMKFNRRPGDFGDSACVYGYDPDGNVIEILELKDMKLPYHGQKLRSLLADKAAAE
jgi:catechol 2,3-dioxygenase-like lactoylglutathione lyase family enzyme